MVTSSNNFVLEQNLKIWRIQRNMNEFKWRYPQEATGVVVSPKQNWRKTIILKDIKENTTRETITRMTEMWPYTSSMTNLPADFLFSTNCVTSRVSEIFLQVIQAPYSDYSPSWWSLEFIYVIFSSGIFLQVTNPLLDFFNLH